MTINVFGGGNSSAPVFPVQRSVRLRSSASAYFNRTPASAGNRQVLTWSGWVKRGSLGSNQTLFAADNNAGANYCSFFINASNIIQFNNIVSSANTIIVTTAAVFRDPSAWYHIILAVDTTQATNSNGVKIYVNGVQQTLTFTTYTQSTNTAFNNNVQQRIGALISGAEYLDGYLTEVNLVDGQQLTPTSFGSYNSTTGVWQPIKYSGTYGTNGFYLNFQDNSAATAAAIGKDSSGNANNWTPNGISVTAGVTYDSMVDVPTLTGADNANFCTWSPIAGTNISTFLSAGNLNFLDAANGGVWRTTFSTINVSTGKYYHEMTFPSSLGSSAGNLLQFSRLNTTTSNPPANSGTINYGVYWNQSGTLTDSTQTISIGTIAANDILMLAIDVANGRLWVGKNGTWFSGNPATNTSPSVTWTPYEGAWSQSVFSNNVGGGGQTGGYTNFGQRPFSYTPPTGFKSLNTYNLPDSTIPSGATQFAATTYTGTGSSLAISNTVNGKSFQPDFVWVKGRSGATDSGLYDSVRGTTIDLISNSTAAETTQATGLTAFGSGSFTVGALAKLNTNAATYVGWQWKGGGAAVTNTSGSISSQVSANPSAGFSVVTYTGTGAIGTVGHGLGVAPKMMIMRARNGASAWPVYHESTGNTGVTQLQSNGGFGTFANMFNNTSPTSTVFTLGTDPTLNGSGGLQLAYCFAEIAGFSKFGSYTGNGSADGPFVYTGFRPRWVMYKRTNTTGSWIMWDTSRSPFNVVDDYLFANSSAAEGVFSALDILSNGFKLRNTDAENNGSGSTFIYAAFAENPFKNSLAR